MKKKPSLLSEILEDWYWLHRNFRPDKFSKHSKLGHEVYTEILEGKRRPTKEESIQLVYVWQYIRTIIDRRIGTYIKELMNDYRAHSQ